MSWSPGQHAVLLGLALVLALRLASGWAVLPATLVLWVALVLAAGLVDALFRRRRTGSPAAQVEHEPVAPASATLAPLHGPVPRIIATVPAPAPAGREWRRHVVDLAPFHNERYPRADICATHEMFLRAGDVLLLRFHPDTPGEGRAPAHWPCDLCAPEQGARRWFEVGGMDETRIAIERTGVHSLGIGQDAPDASAAAGSIGVWLAVAAPDALSLPLEPADGATCRYEHDAEGGVVARIEGERPLQTHARLPARTVREVPRGACLLFASDTDAWDVAGTGDPSSDWLAQYRHLHRWYLQLSRGDVLVLEQAWQADTFDRRLPRDDGAAGFTDGALRLYGFVRGPHLYNGGVVDGRHAFTCGADGFHCLELELHGSPEWRCRPATDFVDLRLWGAFLQRPQALRDFDLRDGQIEDWYRMPMPVPRDLA